MTQSETTVEHSVDPGESKTFRDPVHKDIELHEWEVAIVNTAEFQRLRRIKQLGLADLVYPGAVHNRFLHSLGTLHMAQVIIDHINRNNPPSLVIDEDKRVLIRLVALLHDIGHLPFGHMLEKECNLLRTRHDQRERLESFMGEDTDIGRILGARGMYKNVLAAVSALGDGVADDLPVPAYVVDIVGNTICADLLDYLKRDGRACGLNLEYDDRILRYFDIVNDQLVVRLEKHGQYRRDNVSELLSLLGSRYSLAEKVLFHHTKLTASAMLAEAFQLSGFTEQKILKMGEEELLTALTQHQNEAVVRLSRAVQNRSLYKMFFLVQWEDAQIENRLDELHNKFYKLPDERARIERELETAFGMGQGSVIIYCPEKDMMFKPANVQVVLKSRTNPVKLSEVGLKEIQSEVEALKTKHEALWRMAIYVDPNYFHLATELAAAFKNMMKREGTVLENALDRRPPPRYDLLLAADEVVEEFAREKDLKHSQKQGLKRQLVSTATSARSERVANSYDRGEDLRDTLRRSAEDWYAQNDGKQTS